MEDISVVTNFLMNMWATNPVLLIALVFILVSGVIALVVGVMAYLYTKGKRY